MIPAGWRAAGEGSWHLRWSGGEAWLHVYPCFAVADGPMIALVERLLDGGGAFAALEACFSGGLVGVICRYAVPGVTSIDRRVAILRDDRHGHAVRLDRRGDVPAALIERAWRAALASLPAPRRCPAASLDAIAHWST